MSISNNYSKLNKSAVSSPSLLTNLRVNTSERWKRKRLIIFFTFMLIASFGFLLNIFTYESLNFDQIRLAFAHLPKQWDKMGMWLEQEEATFGFMANATVAEWDQPQLLNLSSFIWELNNESLCHSSLENGRSVVPVLIHTARSHFTERLAIRKSWGSNNPSSLLKNWIILPVFLLGQGDSYKTKKEKLKLEDDRLLDESRQFGDIILGSFIDSYRNLTYKHMMGYKWILNYCQNAAFVLKVDDDFFVDVVQWFNWREADLKNAVRRSNNPPALYCYTYTDAKPRRQPQDKWFISRDEYSGDFYPDYCMGGAYGTTVEFIKKIYYISNFARIFWVDDVFVTGILREIAKQWFKYDPVIKPIWEGTSKVKDYQAHCDDTGNYLGKEKDLKAVVAVPRGDSFESLMMCLWNKLLWDHDSAKKIERIGNY